MVEKQYSVIEYQYRDASNFKAYGEILVEGIFSKNDDDHEWHSITLTVHCKHTG